MRRVRARCVLGLVSSLAVLSLSCGSGDGEGLFTNSSVAGGGAKGVAGGAGLAGSHANAGSAGAAHAGAGGSTEAGGPGLAGSPAGGSAGSVAGSAGQPAGGTSGSTGGSAGAGGATCVDNSACAESEYCAKSSCAAKAEGHCAARPADCANAKLAVLCGCDGLTYHDECLLHANRQNSGAVGPCTKAEKLTVTCTFLDDEACIDAGGECALKVDACASISIGETGTCWVLPEACPGSDEQSAQTCSEKVDPSCQSECAAIKGKARYSTAGKCN